MGLACTASSSSSGLHLTLDGRGRHAHHLLGQPVGFLLVAVAGVIEG
jgi:hypothetical protein